MNAIGRFFKWVFGLLLKILLFILIISIGYGIYRYIVFTPMINGVAASETLVQHGYDSVNPRSYDPHQASAYNMNLLYSGLVALNSQSQVIPDLADRWEINEDGTVYTFYLRENAKFHNGRKVLAQDIKYSLQRSASQVLNSPTAPTYLNDIVGFDEFHSGDSSELLGVKVINDQTIEISIDAPKPYFLYKLTYPTAYILDKQNIDQGSEWYKTPNGTGPYKLKKWVPSKYWLYEANHDFYLESAKIPYLMFNIVDEYSQDLYEKNQVDIADVYSTERFMQESEPLHNELEAVNNMCTAFIYLDNTKPPFDDVHVRRAFTMAMNRTLFINKMYRGHAVPNTGVFPQGMPGFNMYLNYIPYDPAGAIKELGKSKYANTKIEVTVTDSGDGKYASFQLAMLGQMWKDTLGVDVSVHNIQWDYYQEKINAGEHGELFDYSWCADYTDPENFADALFHTGAAQNRGHYSNPQLDKILDDARVEQDVDKRISMYQEAERIIVDDAPVIFTAYPTDYYLVKPYLQGYTRTAITTTREREISLSGKKWYLFKSSILDALK
jgi:oligopeptide transport system substrate-binding protein